MIKRSILVILSCIFISPLTFSVAASDEAVCRAKEAGNAIALTFDDGPHPKYTAEILEILKKYGVNATFFVIGKNAEEYPELVAREAGEGHEIGNHSYSHTYFSRSGDNEISREIEKCEKIVEGISGLETSLLRPPGGLYGGSLKTIAKGMSYRIVLWGNRTSHRTNSQQ